MTCSKGRPTILSELKDLVNQIGDNCCEKPPCPTVPCCPPCCVPFAQVTMTCPPPILAPIYPEPVQPLQLPCSQPPCPPVADNDPAERSRYDNFYNNYNIDWHSDGPCGNEGQDYCNPQKKCGVTVAGKNTCCENYEKKKKPCGPLPGCPTGFKPCTMKLSPPPCCDPCGVWCAQVQPCPPKPRRKVSNFYEPSPCTRPCCKHWEPKEGPCLYDDPCKASCFNHPPGMKPSGKYP